MLLELAVLSLSPPVTGRAAALTTPNKGVCFVFWFPCLGCRAGDDHQGAGCAHGAQRSRRSREGTPRGHSGHPAASDTAAPFIIGLHVQCELPRGGRGSEALSLSSFCVPSPHPRSRSLLVPALPERKPGRAEGHKRKSTSLWERRAVLRGQEAGAGGGRDPGPNGLQGDIYAVTPRTRGARTGLGTVRGWG